MGPRRTSDRSKDKTLNALQLALALTLLTLTSIVVPSMARASENLEILFPANGDLIEADDYSVSARLVGLEIGSRYQLLVNGMPGAAPFVAAHAVTEVTVSSVMYPTSCYGNLMCSCTIRDCLPPAWAWPGRIDISQVFRPVLVQLLREPGPRGTLVAQSKVELHDTRFYDLLSHAPVVMTPADESLNGSVAIDLPPRGLREIERSYLTSLVSIDEVNEELVDYFETFPSRVHHEPDDEVCVRYIDVDEDLPTIVRDAFDEMMEDARELASKNLEEVTKCNASGAVTCKDTYSKQVVTTTDTYFIPHPIENERRVSICAERFDGDLEEIEVGSVASIDVKPKWNHLDSTTTLSDVDTSVTIFVNSARLTYAHGKFEDAKGSLPDIPDREIPNDTIVCPWESFVAPAAISETIDLPITPNGEVVRVHHSDPMGFSLDGELVLEHSICRDHDWRPPIERLEPEIEEEVGLILDHTWDKKGPYQTFLSQPVDDALSGLEMGRDDGTDSIELHATLESVQERPFRSRSAYDILDPPDQGIRITMRTSTEATDPVEPARGEFWTIPNGEFRSFGRHTPDVYPIERGHGDNLFDIAVTYSTGFFNQVLHSVSETPVLHPPMGEVTWGDLAMCVPVDPRDRCTFDTGTCSCSSGTGGALPVHETAELTGERLAQFIPEFAEFGSDRFELRLRPTLPPVVTLELQPEILLDTPQAWPLTLNLGQYVIEFVRVPESSPWDEEVVLTWAYDFYDPDIEIGWGDMDGRLDAVLGAGQHHGTLVQHGFTRMPDEDSVAVLVGAWIDRFVLPSLIGAVREIPSVEFEDVVGLDRTPFTISHPDASWSRTEENVTIFGTMEPR